MLLLQLVEHRVPSSDPTVLYSKLNQYPDEVWGWALCVYPWSLPRRGSQSMVDVSPSTNGKGTERSKVVAFLCSLLSQDGVP